MAVNSFVKTWGKAFPWLSLDLSRAIREKSKAVSSDPYEQTLIQNDLYKRALDEKKHEDFVKERTQWKMELYERAKDSKNVVQKRDNTTLSRTGSLADMLRNYGHSLWKDWDSIGDQELIERFVAKNPWNKADFDDFINGDESDYSFAKRMWFVATSNEDKETFWQKTADVGVGIAQSPWKRGYNLYWQRFDRVWEWIGSWIANMLSDDQKEEVKDRLDKNTIFKKDRIDEYAQVLNQREAEWNKFNGRENTDITKPILWEERAKSKYTKAWETIGDIATWIAMTAPAGVALAPVMAESSLGWAALLWGMEWALDTALTHLWTEWNLDISPTEAAIGVWAWALGWMFTRYMANLPKNQQDTVRKEAEQYINKSIKPTVKWKMSQADYNKFIDDTLDVVDLMDKNKGILQYTDDAGNAVKWQMPTNMRETSETLWNLKKVIYDQYNEIAKQAWDNWARVNMNKAFQQLDDLSKDISQNIANPQTKNIIDTYKNALLEYTDDAGTIAIEDAQKLTQDFNKQLTAFFKNPNMNDVSKNSIVAQLNKWTKDAINDSIDDVLDNSIKNGSSASSQYTQLKSFYGKIKTIEDEISKRALVEARKNAKGLSSTILDSLSWWELTSAVLSLDPVKAGKAWVMNLISRYYNYVNNPNTQLNNLFKLVERTNNPTTTQTITQWIKNTVNQWVKNVAQQAVKPNVLTSTSTAIQRGAEKE